MADTLHFELVSPEKLLRSAEVHMVVVPGTEGDFGVLAGHAPFMSTIRPGAIQVFASGPNDVPERIFVDGGFAEVSDKGLTILAESAVPVGELAPEAIARDLAEARELARTASGDAERAILDKRVASLEARQALAVN